ncbi:MAG: DUF2723 domain-containing protein, partial [Bacteroidota bacterium]|nr:DUF2723 domain-containing protein [Bacteroidota bacterium]
SGLDNVISGAGPQKDLPESWKDDRTRNSLFALPFVLGLIGLYYHYKRSRRDFTIVFFFFFMTGLAIVLYLNMPSPQPRERDYAFVGSFYVFAIWVGLGVLGIYELLRQKMAAQTAAALSGAVCLLAVPVIMAA